MLMISRSSLKLGHLGLKTRSRGKIKRKPCEHSLNNIYEATIMHLLKMYALFYLGQVRN